MFEVLKQINQWASYAAVLREDSQDSFILDLDRGDLIERMNLGIEDLLCLEENDSFEVIHAGFSTCSMLGVITIEFTLEGESHTENLTLTTARVV